MLKSIFISFCRSTPSWEAAGRSNLITDLTLLKIHKKIFVIELEDSSCFKTQLPGTDSILSMTDCMILFKNFVPRTVAKDNDYNIEAK